MAIEHEIANKLITNKWRIAFAESLTGGLLCSTLINAPGISACIGASFITYSNDAKQELVYVAKETLDRYGAVSAQCAVEMAKGAAKRAGSDIAISVTGEAGPEPSEAWPVGTVFIGYSAFGKHGYKQVLLSGDRRQIRKSTVDEALQLLQNLLEEYTKTGEHA